FDQTKTVTNGKIYTLTEDMSGDQEINIDDLQWEYLNGDGDFRSAEITKLRDESDVIITNPPFSLYSEFLLWIMEAGKEFVIIGSMNAITYKEVFPFIMNDKMWLGNGFQGGNAYFSSPFAEDYGEGVYYPESGLVKFRNVNWFTNLDHGKRHQPLPLMTTGDNLKFSKHKEIRGKKTYDKYDNYDAIEVPFTDAIPSDYDGVMGVPVSFLDKYNPDQFRILGTSDNGLIDDRYKLTPGLTKEFVDDYYKAGGTGAYKEGNPTAGYYKNNIAKMAYKRIFIKHRREANK
ncbi:MAG: DNA methyltransferase, partial [Crenarchaeota archaeon]|nr:DNA methyltransferase [Thermoproteota archaeon]